MCKAYLVPGTHEVRLHVDAEGKQAECPVSKTHDGIALIVAPIDHDIRRDILNTPGLLQIIRSMMPGAACLKISES